MSHFNIILLYMIIDKYKKNNITTYIVDKNISDEKMTNYEAKIINNSMINFIIKEDADIYNKDNVLLAKFRKKVMNPKPKRKTKKISQSISHIDADNSIGFVAAVLAIKKAIQNAKKTGIGLIAVKNSGHY